jgi:hypothetical protein
MNPAPFARTGNGRCQVVIAQRIIKSKGSLHGRTVGTVRTFASVGDVADYAARAKKCFYFLDADGNVGLARSIRSSKRRAYRVTVNVAPAT